MPVLDLRLLEELKLSRLLWHTIAQLDAQYPRTVPPALMSIYATVPLSEFDLDSLDGVRVQMLLQTIRRFCRALEQLQAQYPRVVPDALLRAYEPLKRCVEQPTT